MSKLTRRDFMRLSGGGIAAGTASVTGLAAAAGHGVRQGGVTLPYPRVTLVAAREVQVGVPHGFAYPDPHSPCVLLRMGYPVPGGIGPDTDLVAHSTMCTHMGCIVTYDAAARTLKCPCHFSIFDPEKGGQQVCGQATENLPRIVLEYQPADDSIAAVAVDGLLYGRQANIL